MEKANEYYKKIMDYIFGQYLNNTPKTNDLLNLPSKYWATGSESVTASKWNNSGE